MEIDNYALLNDDREKPKKNKLARVISRISLPEAVDDIGRRKEKFEKTLTVLLVLAVIAITIVSIVSVVTGYPSVSSSVSNEPKQTPLLLICSVDNSQPVYFHYISVSVVDIEKSESDLVTLQCEYAPASNVSTCGPLIRIEGPCAVIGLDEPRWSIQLTMLPEITVQVQFLKPTMTVQSQFAFFTKLISRDLMERALDPAARRDFTLDLLRSGFVYSLAYTQEKDNNTLRYPTTLLNLGPVPAEFLVPATMPVYPFTFFMQLRSDITTVISRQSLAGAAFTLISSIGGLASTINTVLSVFIGVVLTRMCFSDRSAFFDHKTRLAATYFVHQQQRQNQF